MKTKGPSREQSLEAIETLGRLSEAFHSRRQALAASVGLTEGQWGLLEEISTEHFMPSMFAKSRSSSAAAVSKTLRQLKEKGLVTAALGADDARHRDYELTAKGRRLLASLRAGREAAIKAIWGELDGGEVRAFAAFGSILAARLQEYKDDGRGR
jgi:DNA-binding MarR family transcriptional regulator